MSSNPTERHELLRALGPISAVAVVVGSVIGSGVFMKPQMVAQRVDTFELAAMAWVLGGVLALLGSLALAELGAMLPRAGGNYVYLKEGYGPLWGFMWGWVDFWILRTGSTAALGTIFSKSLAGILKAGFTTESAAMPSWVEFLTSPTGIKALTIAIISVLTVVNVVGVRWGGLVQNVTTWLKVGTLLTIAILPFALGQANVGLLSEPGVEPPSGRLVGFGAAVLGVLWAYHGWMNLGPMAEELRDPQRNIPRALLIGVGIVMFCYLAANFAYAVILPLQVMADITRVNIVAESFAQEVFRGWGPAAMAWAGSAVSAAIMVSTLGALNSQLLAGPRTYFAMGRDGLWPAFFGQVHATFRTPMLSIILVGVWAIGLVLGAEIIRDSPNESPFDTLTNYVMFGAIIFETMTISSIFVFRKKHPDWPRPYRCWGYPFVPALYVLVLACVLVNTVYDQRYKSAFGFGFIVVGALVHFAYSAYRRKAVPAKA